MTDLRALVRESGQVRNSIDTDRLLIGGVDIGAAGTLTIGNSIATAITIGKAGIVTTFPGDVNVNGILTIVDGGSIIGDGDVTLGGGDGDTITLGGTYTSANDIVNIGTSSMGGDTIVNLRVDLSVDAAKDIRFERATGTGVFVLPSASVGETGAIRINTSNEFQWWTGSWYTATTTTTLHNGVITLPTLTDSGAGSVIVGNNGVITFFSAADGNSNVYKFSSITGGTIALTDNSSNFIYADYNGGSPVYNVTTSASTFFVDGRLSPVCRVYRAGTDLHITDYDAYGLALPPKILYKDIVLNGFERQTGLLLSTAATRISTIEAGTAWFGVRLFNLAVNTAGSSGTLTEFYHVGGVWTKAVVTSYDSSYYDDGTDRQALGVAKYVSKYFFRGVESTNEAYYIHGDQKNTLADALAELIPTIPSEIADHSIYVGKIIIQFGSANGVAYPVAWGSTALLAGVTSHNDLSGLQGGTTGEYYHLTSSNYTDLTGGSAITLHTHTLDTCYNGSLGASSISVDAGDISWNQVGAYSFNIDVTGVTGGADGWQVLAGTDYITALYTGANALAYAAQVTNYDVDATMNSWPGTVPTYLWK